MRDYSTSCIYIYTHTYMSLVVYETRKHSEISVLCLLNSGCYKMELIAK